MIINAKVVHLDSIFVYPEVAPIYRTIPALPPLYNISDMILLVHIQDDESANKPETAGRNVSEDTCEDREN